jgi:MinD-like ATPase involved in chromosome partitioning or flagellar assembly
LTQKRKLGRAFKMELIKLKGRSFYTDVESFQNAIERLFQEIQKRKEHKNIKVEVIEADSESIEIVITQIDSKANRDIKEMVDEVEDGDFKMLKESLTNLCDWSIESDSENGGYRVNYLSESTEEKSKKLVDAPDGFRHILRFYKK